MTVQEPWASATWWSKVDLGSLRPLRELGYLPVTTRWLEPVPEPSPRPWVQGYLIPAASPLRAVQPAYLQAGRERVFLVTGTPRLLWCDSPQAVQGSAISQAHFCPVHI